ncbi:MAG: DUF3667 domain-containing protein [Myxococcales bacterium FL481]|nr:MAG: DUF3667 domain-containing protein [Myxococcales bacterium FL481]
MSPQRCTNCHAEVVGRFCPQCGQRNRSYRESFAKLAAEILREAFEVDGRIPRTLLPFFFRPGYLVEQYIAGRRVHYSSPLRVYLFTLVVGFFALSFVADRFADSIAELQIETEAASDSGDTVDIVATETEVTRALATDETSTPAPAADPAPLGGAPANGPSAAVERSQDEPWTRAVHRTLRQAHERGDEPVPQIVLDKFAELERMGDELATQQILRALLDLAPKAVSALVPVLATLLLVVQVRRPFFFVEHLVFSLNLHALALVVLSVSALIGPPVSEVLPWALAIHMLLGMRRVYGQSWAITLIKGGFVSFAYAAFAVWVLAAATLGALWFA